MKNPIYRIHPAIGFARLGNAEPVDDTNFFIASDTPGIPNNWNPATGKFNSFKTPDGRVKKQAVRFRIWRYEDDGTGRFVPRQEVNLDTAGIQDMKWSVHLANRKASFITFDGPNGESDNFQQRLTPSELRNQSVVKDRAALLEIDEGPKSISGRNAQDVRFDNSRKPNIPIDGLGQLRTDGQGRLLVLGGKGQSESTSPAKNPITDYVNNDTWFDDVSDGPVTATLAIRLADGTTQTVTADNAWVVVAPPDFAPSVGNAITMYDCVWDVAVRSLTIPPDQAIYDEYVPGKGLKRLKDQNADSKANGTLKSYKPSFTREILPIFQRSFLYTKVHQPGTYGAFHYTFGESEWASLADPNGLPGVREVIFGWMRDRAANVFDLKQMPRGLGDNYQDPELQFEKQFPDCLVSLPRTQYAWLRQWKDGFYEADWNGTPPVPAANANPAPEELDRAALENCVGGPFYPGIESGWLIRNPAVYSEPFRIKLGANLNPAAGDTLTVRAGFFTQQMALPWQADFYDCHKEEYDDPDTGEVTYYMWWAAQRPDDVYRNRSDAQMTPWVPFIPYENNNRFEYMRKNWSKLGFVIEDQGVNFETERAQDPNLDVVPDPPK